MNKGPWGWAALALGLLLAADIRADEPAKALPPEVAWIPQTSTAFIHIRFAELWNSPVGRDVAKIMHGVDPKALEEFEKHLGIPLSRLDRVTVLLPDIIEGERGEPGVVIRLTTTRPYDRRDVLAAFKASPLNERPDPDQKAGDLYRADGQMLLHLTDERNLTLFVKDGGIGLLGRILGKKAGPLASALKLAAGKNQIVASLNVAQLPRIPVDQFPPEAKALRPLLEAKTATLTANLGADALQLAASIAFASKEDADEGKQALEEGRKLLLTLLEKGEQELKRDKERSPELELLKEVQTLVKSAKLEQQGATIRVAGQLRINAAITKILAEGTGAIRTSSNRTQSQNNLKQIGLAFHNYNDTYNGLPTNAIYDKNGKPLLSWRVAILPFIEQDNLYKQFHLDEPWDSDHNKKLSYAIPKIYLLPGDTKKHELPSTYYQAFVGPHAAFEGKTALRIPNSFPDGTSNTVWTAEAAEAVPWTKPDDIVYDPKKMPKLGFHFGDRRNVGFVDGSVRALKKTIPESTWHLLIQRDDGQVIPRYDD